MSKELAGHVKDFIDSKYIPSIEAPNLEMLDEEKQVYVGTLSNFLKNLYLLVIEVQVAENVDGSKVWSDKDAAAVCDFFGGMVTEKFRLTYNTDFFICAGYKVAIAKTPEVSAEQMSQPNPSGPRQRFIEDMMPG